jgi:hypothetical protein
MAITPREEAEELLWHKYKTLRTYQFESSVWKQFAYIRAYDEANLLQTECLKYGDQERSNFYTMVKKELGRLDFDEVCPYEP